MMIWENEKTLYRKNMEVDFEIPKA
jgi:hypothetical protein